jgi:hypothetical protein
MGRADRHSGFVDDDDFAIDVFVARLRWIAEDWKSAILFKFLRVDYGNGAAEMLLLLKYAARCGRESR